MTLNGRIDGVRTDLEDQISDLRGTFEEHDHDGKYADDDHDHDEFSEIDARLIALERTSK